MPDPHYRIPTIDMRVWALAHRVILGRGFENSSEEQHIIARALTYDPHRYCDRDRGRCYANKADCAGSISTRKSDYYRKALRKSTPAPGGYLLSSPIEVAEQLDRTQEAVNKALRKLEEK